MKTQGSLLARSFHALAFSAGCALAVGCAPQVTVAPATSAGERIHTLTVVGHGQASARPDVARASLGVETTAATVADATSQAAKKMAAILAALKGRGVAEKDIQTESFTIHFERLQPDQPYHGGAMPMAQPDSAPRPLAATPPGSPVAVSGPVGFYRVSQMLAVKMRELDRVGSILDAAVGAGANQIHHIGFALDDPRPLDAKAREAAISDAKARATQLAELAGLTLGDVLVIDEAPDRGMPVPMPMMAKMMDSASVGTPIAAGEITAQAQVEVVYSIR